MSTLAANQTRETKFNHSVPIPWLYKFGSKVLADYLCFKGKIPKLIYESKRMSEQKAKYACSFLLRVERNLPLLKKIVEKVCLLQNNDRLSASMAYLIVADLLIGNESLRLTSQCKPVLSVLAYQEEIFQAFQELHPIFDQKSHAVYRWVHINKLVTSLQYVKEELHEYGYLQVEYEPKTYEKFLLAVQGLGAGQYLEDFHIKGLLVFPMSSTLSSTKLYQQGKILLQDKASCLPPSLSGVGPGMNVVDACAAPGNKTVLLAGKMKNKGHLIAIERDPDRYAVLQQRLRHYGVQCTRCKCEDFTALPWEELQGAHTVIVDAPCSNSGVAHHTDEHSVSAERINKLAVVQVKLLCHALSIPGVQAVIYSTCSIHTRENEGVVCEALEKYGEWFELEDLSKSIAEWKHFGEGDDSEVARKVIRTKPAVDLCHGFFVAKFVAKNATEEEKNDNSEMYESAHKCIIDTVTQFSTDECKTVKKKRKRNHSQTQEDNECIEDAVTHFSTDEGRTSKKKRKDQTRKDNECGEGQTSKKKRKDQTRKDNECVEGQTSKKKRKDQKRKDNECVEDAVTHFSTDEGQTSKKKKKNETRDGNEGIVNSKTHLFTDKNEIIKKKKKRNQYQTQDNKCMQGTVTHFSTNECGAVKKNKKGDHFRTHVDNECIKDTGIQSSTKECGTLKKKRKGSHSRKKENSECLKNSRIDKLETIKKNRKIDSHKDLECIKDTRILFSTDEYGTAKKKKSGNYSRKDGDVICAVDTGTQHSTFKCGTIKKKRKSNHCEMNEDIVCINDTRTQVSTDKCGTVKKKKKGNHSHVHADSECTIVSTGVLTDGTRTAKKQKKSNSSQLQEDILCVKDTRTRFSAN